jgi:hypothetical protein
MAVLNIGFKGNAIEQSLGADSYLTQLMKQVL